MKSPDPAKKKNRKLTCAIRSCIGCLTITVLGIVILVIALAIADANIDHSEKLISSSSDYAEFTAKSHISFGPNVISCEWALKGKDNRKLLSLSALVPSPSDYDVIISGFVVLPEEEAQSILAGYAWEPAPQGDPPADINSYDDYIKKELCAMIDVMGLKDRPLLHSAAFESEKQQESPYAARMLFDADRNTIFFHMTHM